MALVTSASHDESAVACTDIDASGRPRRHDDCAGSCDQHAAAARRHQSGGAEARAMSASVDRTPTLGMRHLASVDPPRCFLDRRHQPFVPVYTEFSRIGPDGKGRIGSELSPAAAYFYSVIISRQGLATDGRRVSQSEREGQTPFRPHNLCAGDFVADYGWTYETIQGLAKECARPHPCWHCGRAHALIRVAHTRGRRNRYIILRCQDLRDEECVPLSMIQRPKRVPTGAAGMRAVQKNELQTAFALEEAVREPGTVRHSRSLPVAETSQTARPCRTVPSVDDIPPESDFEARLMILNGIVRLNDVTVAPEVLRAIASELQVTGAAELESALIGAVVVASIQQTPITATLVVETFARQSTSEQHVSDAPLQSHAAPSKPIENTAPSGVSQRVQPTDDAGRFAQSASSKLTDTVGQLSRPEQAFEVRRWATDRVLELARRSEPGTTVGQAANICDEFYRKCLEHVGGDLAAAESELQRIVTDPRFCGTPSRKPARKPIALIRTAFREDWIWTRADKDDGAGQFARAFGKLAPGDQAEVARLFEDHAVGGSPLDLARLRRHGVSSKGMIAFCRARLGAPPS